VAAKLAKAKGNPVVLAWRGALKIQRHPNGTAIEGEWAPVFKAIEACH
jgi:uncharacterized protein YqgV (UPF0045/DUF77 family)